MTQNKKYRHFWNVSPRRSAVMNHAPRGNSTSVSHMLHLIIPSADSDCQEKGAANGSPFQVVQFMIPLAIPKAAAKCRAR